MQNQAEQGEMALRIAESGAENALLRLVRNPSYGGGETLTIDGGSATVNVSGSTPIIVESAGTSGDFTRVVEVQAHFENTILRIDSWRETF